MKNIKVVDLGVDKHNKYSFFSGYLLDSIEKNIKLSKKVIVYINRRGEYSSLVCRDCSYLYKCDKCDVAMRVHYTPANLVCHSCGSTKEIPIKCSRCGGVHLEKVGVGIQAVENALKDIYKNKNIYRFDTDNIKTISSKKEAMEKLKGADIIIGTKMISTGFDFENVGLIGVILLEQELGIPDYSNEESVYDNIKQLIGRGGRKGESTDILIQTHIPNSEFVKGLSHGNYNDFLASTLKKRKIFNYPPYSEYAELRYRDKSKEKARDFMKAIENKLKLIKRENIEIYFVAVPMKRNNEYIYRISLKGENLREFLEGIKVDILRNGRFGVVFM